VRELRAVFLVNDQAALLVRLKPNVFKPEAGGVGSAADGNKDDVRFELADVKILVAIKCILLVGAATYRFLLAALGRLKFKLDTFPARITTKNLGVELPLDSLLPKYLLSRFRDLCIHTRAADLTKELHHGDLCAKPRPHRTLEPL
jgi:hypothetical protein